MEIRVLKYFLTVVREGGINRAAEVLHITQPILSRQLSQLEEEVGVKLFHRDPRRITLTNEGILLRRREEEILSLVERTEKELVEQEDLVEGLIDIGVLLEPIDMEKFDFIRLEGRERWVVLMGPEDPLAEKEAISAKDLENMPLILARRTNVQNELSNWLGDSFQSAKVLFTSNLSTNGALMVQRGLAYSIAIEGSTPFWDKEKITYRPLYPELKANSAFAWKKGQPFTLAADKFIEHLKCFLGISNV